jgi:hypothetical protein
MACCYDTSLCFDVETFVCAKRGLDAKNTSCPLISFLANYCLICAPVYVKVKRGICFSRNFGKHYKVEYDSLFMLKKNNTIVF